MGWTASVEGPTVTLRGNPDEGELIYLVTLKDRPGKLPLLTDIWYGNPSHLGKKIRSATFEVQEWNPDGVVSGVLRLVQPSGGKVQMEIWTSL